MYGLRINNIFIPLSTDQSIRLEQQSALFEDEIIQGSYSFPFELPITPELKQACGNIDFEKTFLPEKEYDGIIRDGGIQRFRVAIRFIGRNGNKMRCDFTIGISQLTDWMKATKLRDINLGTVSMNADEVRKFVIFEFTEPVSGDANDGDFGIGLTDYDTVPWDTDMATTIANFVTDYNGSSWASIDQATASQPAPNQVKLTANTAGGLQPFDYSDSIAEATLPTNLLMDPWTVAIDDEFDYITFSQGVVAQAQSFNANPEDWANSKCLFPIIKNPNFVKEELDSLENMYAGYLNYYDADLLGGALAHNTTEWPWRFYLVPFPVLKAVMIAVFGDQSYGYDDDWSAESGSELVIVYNNRSIDQEYSITTPDDTLNIFSGTVEIKNHVPDLTVWDFVQALKTWHNLAVVLDDINHDVKLLRNDTIVRAFANPDYIDDWSAHEDTDQPEFDFADEHGLTLQLSPDSDDDVYDEMIKDREGYTELSPVETVEDLGSAIGEKNIRLVNVQNQFYLRGDNGWEFFSEQLDDYVRGEGAHSISTAVGTLPGFREHNIFTTTWFIPYCKQVGDHRRTGDFEPNTKYSFRLLYYRGAVVDGDGVYYLATNHDRDPYGGDFSNAVHWYGDNGKFAKEYEAWQTFIENSRVLFRDFILPFHKQVNLSMLKWIRSNGKKLLLRRVTSGLPFNRRVRVEALMKGGVEVDES